MSAERAPSARAALEGEYEILRELGIGGTAVVYLARKRSTNAEVAIKLIRAAYLEDDEALARFAREARYASRLDHPNVVPIREVLPLGGGGVALIMPHVPGRTLKQFIREEGRLPAERAERVLRDVAAGLSAAHAMEIIHRDVKPENIFIDENGDALLADFGLARSTANDAGDNQLTMTGVAIGTPTYMPPEQIDGGVIDARGDVYSLGLVAWEMLTGKRPWDGDSLYALLYHQKHDYLPDVREFRNDVSDGFAEVIATAIEKTPEARWQSVAEMVAALDGVIPTRRNQTRPAASDTVRISRTSLATRDPVVSPVLSPAPAATRAPVRPPPPNFNALKSLATELDAAQNRRRRLAPAIVVTTVAVAALVALNWRSLNVRWEEFRAQRSLMSSVASGGDTSATSTTASASGTVPAPLLDSAATVRAADAAAKAARRADTAAQRLAVAAAHPLDAPRPEALSPVVPAGRSAGVQSGTPRGGEQPRSAETTQTPVAAPIAPPIATPAATRGTIVAGGMHTCLITAEGRGYCWGANTRGQLGTTNANRVAVPTQIGGDLELTSIAAGLSHSCALTRGGAAWCWGEGDHGQLGDRANAGSHAAPVRVVDGHVFHALSAGAAHSCALDADGTAWCWGAGNRGQLGNGGTSDANVPVAVQNWHFNTIAAGWNFSCGLDGAGRAFCWGQNDAGELATRDTVDRTIPAPVTSDVVFTSIAAGASHACATTAQGDAYCWGKNSNGQLGDGSTVSRLSPARVKSDVRFSAVTAGAAHSCGLDASGQAFCWGLDSYGQLGDGGSTSQQQPVAVAGNHHFTSLRAFGSHTCGSTTSGESFCWGYNLEGQLGDGTRANRSRPVYVEQPTVR